MESTKSAQRAGNASPKHKFFRHAVWAFKRGANGTLQTHRMGQQIQGHKRDEGTAWIQGRVGQQVQGETGQRELVLEGGRTHRSSGDQGGIGGDQTVGHQWHRGEEMKVGLRCKRGSRAKGKPRSNVPFERVAMLNMRGGRRRGKWEELYRLLTIRSVDIMIVTETHLCEMEVPPGLKGYNWYGTNRNTDNGENRFGGVGILTRDAISCEEAVNAKMKDLVVIEIRMEGTIWAVMGVYRAPSNTEEEDEQLFERVYKVMEEYQDKGGVICLGDWNAHIEQLDGREDRAGRRLIQLAESSEAQILNLDPRVEGRYTYTQGDGKSCVDYVLTKGKIDKWVDEIRIDEEKTYNVGSDHNWVEVSGRKKKPGRVVVQKKCLDKHKWAQKVEYIKSV